MVRLAARLRSPGVDADLKLIRGVLRKTWTGLYRKAEDRVSVSQG